MHAHAGGRGQFGRDAPAGQRDAVVARTGNLPAAVGIGPETGLRTVVIASGIDHIPDDRHEGHVEEVTDAGALEVGMAEADDRGVGGMVAGGPVPLLRDAGGAELDHAERHAGADEDMAVAAGTDPGIDVLGKVFFNGGSVAGGQDQGRGCQESGFHLHWNSRVPPRSSAPWDMR